MTAIKSGRAALPWFEVQLDGHVVDVIRAADVIEAGTLAGITWDRTASQTRNDDTGEGHSLVVQPLRPKRVIVTPSLSDLKKYSTPAAAFGATLNHRGYSFIERD
jgi:hypothetical protein